MAAIQNSNKLTVKDNTTDKKSDQDSHREQRARLIKALGKFKPQDANPLQFYNCVREFCIMHNCSIDEGMDRAIEYWPKLSMRQRALYNSERHAELPIPVPRHLIYRAFQMERNGRWSLGRAPVGNNGATMYTVESYKPPQKISKFRALLKSKKPKYDNLIDPLIDRPIRKKLTTAPAATRTTQSKPGTSRKARTLTPPEQRVTTIGPQFRHAISISRLLSVKSNVKLMKKNHSRSGNVRGGGGAAAASAGGAGGDGGNLCGRKIIKTKKNKKFIKRKPTSTKKKTTKKTLTKQLAKDKDIANNPNKSKKHVKKCLSFFNQQRSGGWNVTKCGVRRRMMHPPSK